MPGILAIGDVTGKLALAHFASAQGIVAAEGLAGVETHPLDYDAMPRYTYCQPQAASFGLPESQAVERGYQVRVGKFFFLANGKALSLGERDGFVKIVTDELSSAILGAHLVGPEVTELLAHTNCPLKCHILFADGLRRRGSGRGGIGLGQETFAQRPRGL